MGGVSRALLGLVSPVCNCYTQRSAAATAQSQFVFILIPRCRSLLSPSSLSLSLFPPLRSGGRYILSRDYLTLKLWDVNMESRPLATFKVHEGVRGKLCDLYENDSIFDKFECCVSGRGDYVASGSYSHLFSVFNVASGNETTLEARGRHFWAAPPVASCAGFLLLLQGVCPCPEHCLDSEFSMVRSLIPCPCVRRCPRTPTGGASRPVVPRTGPGQACRS